MRGGVCDDAAGNGMTERDPELDKCERRFANQLDKYWQSMRSQLNLCARSPIVDSDRYQALRDELSDILDLGIINYPQTLSQIGLSQDQSYDEKKKVLGLNFQGFHRTDIEEKFIQKMAWQAQEMRKSNWSWRIAEEAEEKHRLGWHPFFVTLTIDPSKTDENGELVDPEKIWKEGREFRKYIRRIANIVCKELGHPPSHKPPYRPESDYVTYAGVIEHGKSRSHHHGHFIIWIRCIPASWRVCPNASIRVARNRTKNECLPMRALWPWAAPRRKPHLYFRYQGDVWEKQYNFVLPLKEDGKPMKVSRPRVAGHYITKYLSKEFKEWNHRVKATRNLGMTRLREVIRGLSTRSLEALTWRAKDSNTNHLMMTIHSVPLGLLRSVAKREMFLHLFKQNQLELETVLKSNYGVFTKMLRSVRNGVRADRMHSLDFFDWVGQFLGVPKGFCEKRQIEAHFLIQKEFRPDERTVKHTKLGANEIGRTYSI